MQEHSVLLNQIPEEPRASQVLLILLRLILTRGLLWVRLRLAEWPGHDKLGQGNKETGKEQECYCSNVGESDGARGSLGVRFEKNGESERSYKE